MNATFVLDRSHSAKCPLFPLPSPPNRSVLRVWSGVQAVLRRGAPSRSNRPIGLLSPTHRPLFSLLRRLRSREKHPHLDPQNVQANSAKHLQRILFRGVCSTGIGDLEWWQGLRSLDFLSAALFRFTKKSVMWVLLLVVAVLLRLTHGTCL